MPKNECQIQRSLEATTFNIIVAVLDPPWYIPCHATWKIFTATAWNQCFLSCMETWDVPLYEGEDGHPPMLPFWVLALYAGDACESI